MLKGGYQLTLRSAVLFHKMAINFARSVSELSKDAAAELYTTSAIMASHFFSYVDHLKNILNRDSESSSHQYPYVLYQWSVVFSRLSVSYMHEKKNSEHISSIAMSKEH